MARQLSPNSPVLLADTEPRIVGFKDTVTGVEQYLMPIDHEPLVFGGIPLIRVVAPAATFVTPSASDNNGKVRLTSAGVHGLTNANSQGKKVYVTWTAGTAVTGLYELLECEDDTDEITIDLDWASGLGTPVVSLVTTDIPLVTFDIPPNRLYVGMTGQLDMLFEMFPSTNNKVFTVNFNTDQMYSQTVAGNNSSLCVERKYCIQSDTAWLGPAANQAGHGASTGLVTETNIFGGVFAAHTMTILVSPSTADEYITLRAWKFTVS
jgi:hypothetical protein